MKDETSTWLSYADENLDVAELALEHGHLNFCLQNAQQAVEKYLLDSHKDGKQKMEDYLRNIT